ncbi:MAG: 8-amino-7-oxononanoate synthase [Leptolyngbyaceae cyanobacterium CSU_1_4]|nr:8-amino-7-oxononanoate synthase [Leptolyngbyaceae cyanobacterium CSU_1_4]
MMAADKFAFMHQALEQRSPTHHRSLHPLVPQDAVHILQDGRSLLNFSNNDYLGLSKRPALIQTAQKYISQYGTGATSSRLVTGTYDIHEKVEQQLAAACGREASLLFNSGFQANSTILPLLVDRQSLVLCDRLVHNSILQGVLSSKAKFIRYHHNNLSHLESLLQQSHQKNYDRILIASETIFSMDGDISDVDQLIHLAQKYDAILYLDDAHAVGVMGTNGMGLASHRPEIDIVIGTFGKAFGSAGAYVVCSNLIRDYLINFCPGFIYTTGLPPGTVGAIAAALTLIPTLNLERQHLAQTAAFLRSQLHQIGYDTGNSRSHIIPLMIGDEAKTLRLAQWLKEHGILAIAIRPPTVAPGTARIRLALSSAHTTSQINDLISCLKSFEG